MRPFKSITVCLTLLLFVLSPDPVNAQSNPISVELKGGKAKVTLLEGSAFVVKKGMEEAQPLAQGDLLSGGDRITTGKKSRIELKMPDGSYLRFDENTTFELQAIAFEKKRKRRKITISMILGKTWAKVSRLFGVKGRFEIATRTAVAGVRGTVYRMNVNRDHSETVKVYWGEVVVNNAMKAAAGDLPVQITKPTKVEGPHPVPGPHPVSME
ncbi:MAG: FecR domain-containing protein, partial [Desulfobacterales bacterium]